MTTEETKQFLWGFRDAQRKYRQLLERINELEAVLTSISIDYSAERVQSTPADMADKIAKLSDLRTEYIDKAEEAVEKMEEICSVIDKVGGSCGEVLHRIYIEGDRFEKIAVDLNYSYRHIGRLHKRGVQLARNVLNDVLLCPKDMC